MKIYIHKVKMNHIDGWGQSSGIMVEILGTYKDKETAIAAKSKRDLCADATCCDVGQSWIEESEIK